MKTVDFSSHTFNRSSLVLGLKIATIIATSAVIFYQDLAIVVNDALYSEFMSHILAIPFFFSYLIYRKRKMIRATITFEPASSHKKIFPYKESLSRARDEKHNYSSVTTNQPTHRKTPTSTRNRLNQKTNNQR